MAEIGPNQVTQILERVAAGDESAAAKLLPLVYDELRKLAESRMARTPPGQTLQATALVHEAYLRVVGDHDSRWEGRAHFFFAAARAMRDILVEQFRRKKSLKRGGDQIRIQLDSAVAVLEVPSENLLALDEALKRLEIEDPEHYKIVMLRYFAGMTVEETANVLELSLATIERKWRFIRAWLKRELTGAQQNTGDAANG